MNVGGGGDSNAATAAVGEGGGNKLACCTTCAGQRRTGYCVLLIDHIGIAVHFALLTRQPMLCRTLTEDE